MLVTASPKRPVWRGNRETRDTSQIHVLDDAEDISLYLYGFSTSRGVLKYETFSMGPRKKRSIEE